MSDTGQSGKPELPPAEDAGRRELLGTLAIGAGTCVALATVAPVTVAVLAPGAADAPDTEAPFLDVAAEADIHADGPTRVELRAMGRDGWLMTEADLGSAWVIRTPGGIRAFSAVCPHLGCSIEKDVAGFFCPCHESRFDGQGGSRSGPSPRSLDPLPVRITGGRVLVQALRFKAGGKTRTVIG